MPVIDDVLDADDVAKMLRVHPRTVARLAGQKKLPGFRVGNQWRFRRQAIEEYIKTQENLDELKKSDDQQ